MNIIIGRTVRRIAEIIVERVGSIGCLINRTGCSTGYPIGCIGGTSGIGSHFGCPIEEGSIGSLIGCPIEGGSISGLLISLRSSLVIYIISITLHEFFRVITGIGIFS